MVKKVPFTTREEINNPKLGINEGNESWKPTKGDSTASLQFLADDLPIIKDDIEYTRNDVSIPSPWANIIFFDSLLQSNNNEFGKLSKQAVKDWRALLTTIALKDIWNINIKIESVDMQIDGRGFADKDFCKNICNMKPMNQFVSNDDCWNKFYLIKIDDCTIGALTNSFLICSAYKESFLEDNYKYTVDYLKNLGFMDEGYNFVDPTDKIKKDFSLLVYMISYCERLRETLIDTSTDKATEDFINKICVIIDSFVKDLKNGLDEQQTSKCNAITRNSNKLYIFEDINDEIKDVYDLFQSIKLKAIDIEPIADIVVDKNKNVLLDKLGECIGRIEQSGKIEFLHCEEYNVVTNEKIFLEKITLVDCLYGKMPFEKFMIGTSVSVECGDDTKTYCCIPPIKEELFDMFDSEYDVRDSISITGDYERGIEASVRFIINGKETVRSRHYSVENYNFIEDISIPFIAIWPYASITTTPDDSNQKYSAWNDFYVFEEDTMKIITGDMHPCDVEIKSKNDKGEYEKVVLTDKKDGKKRSVLHKKHLPTYVKISNINNMDVPEELGIILLSKPDIKAEISEDNEKYVGMDFGTTSTTAFCSDSIGGGNEKFIKFGLMKANNNVDTHTDVVKFKKEAAEIERAIGDDNNGCCVIYQDQAQNTNEPAMDFVPLEYIHHRFYPSMFKTNVKGNKLDIINYPLLNGNIIFDSSIIDENINRNLKWGRHGDKQLSMKGYLSQFMTGIAFTLAKEGVGSIKWRFSYPTALSKSEIKRFSEDVRSISDKIGECTGIISEVQGIYTESIVAAKFHSESHNYICIDVGGGSTDVSLWKGQLNENSAPENLLQFSIGIAARKIFTEALANLIINCKDTNDRSRLNLQSHIGKIDNTSRDLIKKTKEKINPSGQVVSASTDSVKQIMENFGREIEPLIQNNGKNIMDWVMSPSICEEGATDNFFKYIITGFYGILYYTVLSMKQIKDQLSNVSDIKVKFAGNGANIYAWLMRYFRSSDQGEKVFANAMHKLTKEILEIDINYEFDFDDKKLKTEAACGLLRMTEDDSSNERNLITICGDNMKVKYSDGNISTLNQDDNLAANDELEDFFDVNESKKVSDIYIDYSKHSDVMKAFIKSLNEYILKDNSDIKLDLKEISEQEMQRMIRNVLKQNVTNHTLAPAFILELESLLSILAGYDKDAVISED